MNESNLVSERLPKNVRMVPYKDLAVHNTIFYYNVHVLQYTGEGPCGTQYSFLFTSNIETEYVFITACENDSNKRTLYVID